MARMKENRFYLAVILLLLLIMALRTPLDTDMWWHLKAGEQTWSNKHVYAQDTFSFTRQGADWINHSWLSQVLMYILFRGGGYAALSIWVALSAVLSMALVYLQMDGHSLLRGAVLILGGAVASVVWSPRPQIMSLVMFGLISYLLYLFKWKKKNYLVWMLPIFLIWANLHAGYVLGIILIGSLIGGELINKLILGSPGSSLDWPELRCLALVVAGCMVMVLVNPFGIGMWKIPFNTVGVQVLQDLISEWASPDFHQLFQQPLLWMLFLVITVLGTSTKKIDGADLLSLLVFSWLAFTARRNFGPFAMVSAPLVTRYLDMDLEKWKGKLAHDEKEISIGARNWINSAVIILLMATAGWKAFDVNETTFIQSAEEGIFPVEAVEYLQNEQLPGNIFNEYNWGGYLIWNLPEYPVFVDGRTDLYGDVVLADYLFVMSGQIGWKDILDQYGVTILLLRPDSSLKSSALFQGWTIKYQDRTALILVR
jgi:hypothetical protein